MGVEFQLIVLNHPDQSPDLTQSDLDLFWHLKKHLASQKFHEDEEVKNKVITWFRVLCHWNTKDHIQAKQRQ